MCFLLAASYPAVAHDDNAPRFKLNKCRSSDGGIATRNGPCPPGTIEFHFNEQPPWVDGTRPYPTGTDGSDTMKRMQRFYAICKTDRGAVDGPCLKRQGEAERKMTELVRAGPEASSEIFKAKSCYFKVFDSFHEIEDAVSWEQCFEK